MLFAKSFFVLLVSYFILRIAYDRLIFGYIDLRAGSLAELVMIPAGLTVLFFLAGQNVRQADRFFLLFIENWFSFCA